MLAVTIPAGYLYYGETRHRVKVELTAELRQLVREMSDEMHAYFQRGYTPRVKTSKACRSCSRQMSACRNYKRKSWQPRIYKQQVENA